LATFKEHLDTDCLRASYLIATSARKLLKPEWIARTELKKTAKKPLNAGMVSNQAVTKAKKMMSKEGERRRRRRHAGRRAGRRRHN
jgi:hypothetical protein